jgi:hypothetical protein
MIPDPAPQAPSNTIRRWMVTIYAILALAAFAFPAGLRDWLEERNSGGQLWLPLAIARQIEAASQAVGVKQVGESLRQRFQQLIGDDKES